jgi:2-keto-4-pentenoate hydratase/2-oxohepta-3-ene-1,7-dioic acid hydratase in catechol pathway
LKRSGILKGEEAMRLCRFGDSRLGLLEKNFEGSCVRDVTAALEVLPSYRYPLPAHDAMIAHLDQVRERMLAIAPSSPVLPLEGVKLLSPVANPGKIVAAPVNYLKHQAEAKEDPQLHQGNPARVLTIHQAGLFLKATSSLVGAGEGIALRMPERRTDHEVELAFVIGKQASGVSRDDALSYVAGYAIGLDITIRGPEDRSFRKSPDSYTVLGPWMVTADEIPNPGELDLSITVNGQTRQASNTRHMILGVAELIELASSFYTLYPGDVFLTGTPEGVSPIAPGDRVVATIEKIGTMAVHVRNAEVRSA